MTEKTGRAKSLGRYRLRADERVSRMLRGGMPNVGMENWTSDYDRICWNESNPRIKSPLFVPKHNWTEEDFEKARKEPAYQDEVSQWAIQREYERLNGIPAQPF
eukprot:3104093-Rhodomonas_salina.2